MHEPLPTTADMAETAVPGQALRLLRALEESLMHECRAQQELVYVVSARVLDAVQWCAVAAALHPLHCDLEPLLCAILQLPQYVGRSVWEASGEASGGLQGGIQGGLQPLTRSVAYPGENSEMWFEVFFESCTTER